MVPIDPILSFLTQSFSKKMFDEAFNRTKEKLKSAIKKQGISISKSDLEEVIAHHIKSISNQVSQIQIREMDKSKSINDIYIRLDLRLSAKKWDDFRSTVKTTFDLKELFSKDINHLIILGDPGAGKTTSLKKICSLLIFEDNEQLKGYKFPIFIRLRELRFSESLFDRLSNILGIRVVSSEGDISKEDRYEILKFFLKTYIDDLGILLLIDGLDEVSQSKIKGILDEVEELTSALTNSRLILTSRSGPFERLIACSTVYELEPLSKLQIEEFVGKWFLEKRKANKFKKELYSSPFFEGKIKPLDLAQLCAIFHKYEKIPQQPKEIYRKRIRLYLEEWDKQNDVRRDSKFSQLDVDTRFDFFSHFAFQLSDQFTTKVYGEIELGKVYRSICGYFELPKNEMKAVLGELESHTGLIVTSGYDKVEFYHKTTQEYFTAFYLHQLPAIPVNSKFPNEFAIATAICPDPNLYFAKLIMKFLDEGSLSSDFLTIYLNRLLLERTRFKKDPFIVIPLFLAYTDAFVGVNHTRYYCREKDFEVGGKKNEIARVMTLFIKEYFPFRFKRELLNVYRIGSTDTHDLKALYPNPNLKTTSFGQLLAEHKGLLTKKILIMDKYLTLLGFSIDSYL